MLLSRCYGRQAIYWNIYLQNTEAAARQHGSTAQDIIVNSRADKEAKRIATERSPIHPKDQEVVETVALYRQEWLVMLNWVLEMTQPSPDKSKAPKQTVEPVHSVVSRFPQWSWASPITDYPWRPKILSRQKPPDRWTFTEEDWQHCQEFFQGLR